VGNSALRLNATYTFLDQSANTQFFDREEINFGASSQITKNWGAHVGALRDLNADQIRSLNAAVIYENECCYLSLNATRSFFEDRDLEPTDSFFLRLILKTLGEVKNLNL